MNRAVRAIRTSLLAVLAVGGSVVGCHREQHVASGPITLTYWPAANPIEVALAKKLAAAFNAQNPGVEVQVQPIPAGRSSEEVLLAAIVARVRGLIARNEYKRRQAPPIIRVRSRAFGSGRQMPIAAKVA